MVAPEPRVTPQQAWDALIQGDARFTADELLHPHQSIARLSELSGGQAPDVAILGCSDSRVAPEILFDHGLGDLFVFRNIGQIATENAIASMEFAVVELGVALIVVLAHESCGAVQAAINQTSEMPREVTPAIKQELASIQPAVQAEWFSEPRDTPYVDPDTIDADSAGRRHVSETIYALVRSSRTISDAVEAGILSIVGCQYRLTDGRVVPLTAVGDINIGN